jgi:hypothetical protein
MLEKVYVRIKCRKLINKKRVFFFCILSGFVCLVTGVMLRNDLPNLFDDFARGGVGALQFGALYCKDCCRKVSFRIFIVVITFDVSEP